MTHSGQKGFGMTKHGQSGYATRSPRFRFLQKLEAQRTIARTALGSRTRNSRSKSYSIPGSQHEPDELAKSGSTSVAGGKRTTFALLETSESDPKRTSP